LFFSEDGGPVTVNGVFQREAVLRYEIPCRGPEQEHFGQALRDDCPMYFGHQTILQLKSGLGIVLLGGRRTGDGEQDFSA